MSWSDEVDRLSACTPWEVDEDTAKRLWSEAIVGARATQDKKNTLKRKLSRETIKQTCDVRDAIDDILTASLTDMMQWIEAVKAAKVWTKSKEFDPTIIWVASELSNSITDVIEAHKIRKVTAKYKKVNYLIDGGTKK